MENREQVIKGLTELKRELTARLERLTAPVDEARKELEHVSATLAMVLRNGRTVSKEAAEIETFPIAKLRGKTHVEAIVTIARHNQGVVKAQDAKRLLILAGVMRETKNATHMVHSAIIRSDKFERIARGEFRLKEPAQIKGLKLPAFNLAELPPLNVLSGRRGI